MKKLLFLLLAAPAAICVNAQTTAQSSTQHDKQFLLNYYTQSMTKLEQAVKGLSKEQLHYKPAADKWSISQCLEHIVKTETMLWGFVQPSLDGKANPERRAELKMSDDDVIKGITDRSFKAQAPAEIAPVADGEYDDATEAIADLRKSREAIIAYLQKADIENLRNHVSDSPFGPVDGYHSMLYIPGHTIRHTLQIDEIKADKGFPKK